MRQQVWDNLNDQKLRVSTLCRSLVLMLFSTLQSACLPVEVEQPDCFPEEGCPQNLECIEGRCVVPQERSFLVSAQCLGSFGCQEQLLSLEIAEACLILEQPSGIRSIPVNFSQIVEGGYMSSSPLLRAPLRASIILLKGSEALSEGEGLMTSQGFNCQDTAELVSRGLDRECSSEQTCLLRLRAEVISAEQLAQDEAFMISLDGPDGQCIESVWGLESPIERCGGEDLDCDGFIDEGLACEGDE